MGFQLTKPIKILLLAIAVALLGGLAYGGYRYWQSRQGEPKLTSTTKPTADPRWDLYINKENGFSVEYPSESMISEGQLSEFGGDSISFSVASVMLFNISVKETNKDLITLVEEGVTNVSNTTRPLLPNKPNATIAGVPAVVLYVADSRYSLVTIYAFFKRGGFFYNIQHFVPSDKQIDWGMFEHVLRVFEFDNTKNLEDSIPGFPLESVPFTYEEH